jgi:hypothetical protein
MKMMRIASTALATCLWLVFLAAHPISAAEEQAIDKKDVPAAVVTAFEKAYPDAKVTAIAKISTEDQTQYSFEISGEKGETDVVYNGDGILYLIAADMTVEELPAAVIESVQKTFPKGQIDEADKITKGSQVEFEVIIEISEDQTETEHEVIVASDGRILDQARLQDDDDDDEEDDNEEDDDMPGDEEEDEEEDQP